VWGGKIPTPGVIVEQDRFQTHEPPVIIIRRQKLLDRSVKGTTIIAVAIGRANYDAAIWGQKKTN
jgi:hypothetical protein